MEGDLVDYDVLGQVVGNGNFFIQPRSFVIGVGFVGEIYSTRTGNFLGLCWVGRERITTNCNSFRKQVIEEAKRFEW